MTTNSTAVLGEDYQPISIPVTNSVTVHLYYII